MIKIFNLLVSLILIIVLSCILLIIRDQIPFFQQLIHYFKTSFAFYSLLIVGLILLAVHVVLSLK